MHASKKNLLIGLAGAALVLTLVGSALPEEIRVERSTLIEAPAANVFTLLNGFGRFLDWSPWVETGSGVRYRMSGPATGVGARLEWDVGQDRLGSQEIVESRPYERIRVRMQTAGSDTDQWIHYRVEPEDEATRLTWTYEADVRRSLPARFAALFMEAGLANDLGTGLDRVEAIVEALPAAAIAGLEVEVAESSASPLLFIAGTTGADAVSIGTAYAVTLSRLLTYVHGAGLKDIGSPRLVTRGREPDANRYAYAVAVPVEEVPEEPSVETGVQIGQSHEGVVLRTPHRGTLATVAETQTALATYAELLGFTPAGDPWEERTLHDGDQPTVVVNLPVK